MKSLELLQSIEREFGSLQEAKLRALDNDSQLLTFLLSDSTLKARFFTQINDALIFEKEAFLDFLKLRILDTSYTRFANKIGLMIHSHTGAKLLKSDSHIVLNFPYKDCILKGAQSKDEDKSNEIFFNEILGSDEIDFLLKPKALQNFELIDSSLRGSEATEAIQKNKIDCHESANADSRNDNAPDSSLRDSQRESKQSKNLKSAIQNKPNFLIKGNNLLALHTLKSRRDIYGQVKLIYIDPPYNTGNDSFNYNDRFNHSAWLVFMKNRLEIAREFLREDGVIFIQCDDNEQAYLKVLCDEIFGRENFVATICWEKKYSPANDAKWLSDNHDFILIYAKHKETWKPNLLPRTEEMNARYTNLDNDPRGRWKSGGFSVKTYSANYDYPITTPSGKIVLPPSGSCWQTSKENYEKLLQDNRIYFGKNGDSKPQIKQFLSEVQQGVVTKTFWKYDECGHNQIAKQEIKSLFTDSHIDLFSTPKPEALLKRIIEISTKDGDLVMDFFAGSGTTCAVAHKMNRRWIGIEQMDYVEGITKERLIKVINGEQGGISKAVGWGNSSLTRPSRELEKSSIDRPQVLSQSDFSAQPTNLAQDTRIAESNNKSESVKNAFIYCELMPLNALYKEKIAKSSSEGELARIYDELQTKAFIDYRVDIQEMLKDKDFEALSLADKKQILYEILDSNMDYVAYSDMEDSSYCVDSETKELNRAFYKGGENG